MTGYVDSGILGEEGFIPSSTEASQDEEEDDDNDSDDMELPGRSKKTTSKAKAKRKRSPSPPSPQLPPIIYDQEVDQLTDDDSGEASYQRGWRRPPLTLQFNVPLGFHGPLFVKLDNALLQSNKEDTLHEMQQKKGKRPRTTSSSPVFTTLRHSSGGFISLPAELRNKIYCHLFVRKDKGFTIPCGKDGLDLAQSAQFLRTCKLVHNEGCSILYGENVFEFRRHYDTRGPFWQNTPKEIGYQDVLQFLKMIGPENLQYLRDVRFIFDDALPRDTSYLNAHEKRRYLNDDYLMNCLRILRDAKLRTFFMRFIGRRMIWKTDVKFLGYLEQIKADKVEKYWDHDFHYPPQKIHDFVWLDLQNMMTRKKKLFEKK